ncbi:integrase [Candidatus Magnetomorum sp. HK-1]|nr:integrase [Candidatus Magnetomorum sp. HK-1]
MKNNNDYISFLGTEIRSYLNWRKGMGCMDQKHKSLFYQFDRFLIENNNYQTEDITPELFINFRNTLNCEANTINIKMGVLRMFFDYLNRIDSTVENPLQYIPALPEKKFIPFVFSEDEINKLLKAIDGQIQKTESTFLTDLSIYISIVLLAYCGMRISEPLRLKVKHYRSDEKTLYIEKTKFKKDRLIPLPKNAYSELNNYCEVLKSYDLHSEDNHLLVNQKRGYLITSDIYPIYYKALSRIGLLQDKKIVKGNMSFGKSTPHSLRHSFAVNKLKKIKQDGKSPENALPALAQYMGHEKYENTAVYLKILDSNHRKSMLNFYMSDFREKIR